MSVSASLEKTDSIALSAIVLVNEINTFERKRHIKKIKEKIGKGLIL